MEPSIIAVVLLLSIMLGWLGTYFGWEDFCHYILPFLLILGAIFLACGAFGYLLAVALTNSWTIGA